MTGEAGIPMNGGHPGRSRRAGLVVALTAALTLLCCGGGVGSFFLTELDGSSANDPLLSAFGCGQMTGVDINGDFASVGPYGPDQVRNAAIIVEVGAKMSIPPRGWVIAVATAIQESALRNLPHLGERNDHDSVGLFQQRPSQGWGTPEQLQDPAYAARKFYEKLQKIKNWQSMSLTDVAQKVQVSAFPDAYAKHEKLAAQIVNVVTNGAARAAGHSIDLRCTSPGEIAASGWTAPVRAVVVSAFRTSERPRHNGVDLGAGRYTPIRAAASGEVIVARCDTDSTAPYSCDHDGSPSAPGCGWFVDIRHANDLITRYCHMVERPYVAVGEMVIAGQVIGKVGTSGNSSGPHLHFEVHVNADRSGAGAIDPVAFMRDQGAPLGTQA